MNYIKIKCVHRYLTPHYTSESEETEFVLNLKEIAFIEPIEYPISKFDREKRWKIGVKFWNCNERYIIVSQKCGDEIIETLGQMGELKQIEE